MKMTFKISDNHEIELEKQENGTVKAVSMYKTSGNLWAYCFKDFDSIEAAITFYQIKL